MHRPIRYAAIGLALSVNGVALAAVHYSMLQTRDQAQLAATQPERIVVRAAAHAAGEPRLLARESCPAPQSI